MSFEPDDDPVKSSSTEHYSRVGSVMDWAIVLGASSSIFFGFFLDITVNPPSYFQLFDNHDSLSGTLRSNNSNCHVHNACCLSYDALS